MYIKLGKAWSKLDCKEHSSNQKISPIKIEPFHEEKGKICVNAMSAFHKCCHLLRLNFKPLRLFLIHRYKWWLATSDHQCSEKLNFLSGFTLRMWNYVSSSWFERLRISDRKFVNHTTEMILWSMILDVSCLKEHICLLFLKPYHWDMIFVSGILHVIYL